MNAAQLHWYLVQTVNYCIVLLLLQSLSCLVLSFGFIATPLLSFLVLRFINFVSLQNADSAAPNGQKLHKDVLENSLAILIGATPAMALMLAEPVSAIGMLHHKTDLTKRPLKRLVYTARFVLAMADAPTDEIEKKTASKPQLERVLRFFVNIHAGIKPSIIQEGPWAGTTFGFIPELKHWCWSVYAYSTFHLNDEARYPMNDEEKQVLYERFVCLGKQYLDTGDNWPATQKDFINKMDEITSKIQRTDEAKTLLDQMILPKKQGLSGILFVILAPVCKYFLPEKIRSNFGYDLSTLEWFHAKLLIFVVRVCSHSLPSWLLKPEIMFQVMNLVDGDIRKPF